MTKISNRELEVAQMIKEGLRNKEIASRLVISHKTVENHVRSILSKTGAKNRTHAIIFLIKENIIEL